MRKFSGRAVLGLLAVPVLAGAAFIVFVAVHVLFDDGTGNSQFDDPTSPRPGVSASTPSR